MLNQVRKQAEKRARQLGLAGAAFVAFVNQAMAAVPANVTTALTDAGTDAATVAGVVLIAVVGLVAFRWMRREAH